MAHNSKTVNYENLFELWADFDNAETNEEITKLVEEKGLGPVDGVSFMAFCYGYKKACETREGET